MKIKSLVFPTVALLWIIFLFTSPKQQKPFWRGSIQVIDGLTVVKNPKEPMYRENIITVEDELTIGGRQAEDPYIFSDARDIAVDGKGKIYVLDTKEAIIKVFDHAGVYIKKIGHKGQGPGEMNSPSSIQITKKNEMAVNDPAARKIHYFDLEGNFLHAVSQRNMLFFSNPKIDGKGNITASYMIVDEEVTYVLKTFDRQLQEISPIFSVVVLKYPRINPFYPRCYWDLMEEDKIIWGFADTYELFIIDSEGKTVKKITKDFDPIKITEKEKDDLINERFGGRENIDSQVILKWNSHHNPFIYLCVDDRGRIFTRTYEKAFGSDEFLFDVFDREGKYVAKIPLKSKPFVIKKNKLYTIEEDDEGYHAVKRYNIVWGIKPAQSEVQSDR